MCSAAASADSRDTGPGVAIDTVGPDRDVLANGNRTPCTAAATASAARRNAGLPDRIRQVGGYNFESRLRVRRLLMTAATGIQDLCLEWPARQRTLPTVACPPSAGRT